MSGKDYGPAGKWVAKRKYSGPKKEYQKTAMFRGFFDELEKMSQAPGSLAHRMSLGATSPAAVSSIQNLVSGGGLQGGGGDAAPSAAPTPPAPAPSAATPSSASLGVPSGGGAAGLDIPSANPGGAATGRLTAADLGI